MSKPFSGLVHTTALQQSLVIKLTGVFVVAGARRDPLLMLAFTGTMPIAVEWLLVRHWVVVLSALHVHIALVRVTEVRTLSVCMGVDLSQFLFIRFRSSTKCCSRMKKYD